MKYTDEQLIQAGRKAKTKWAPNGLDIMTRPEAKYALKNSLPLSMVRAYTKALPPLPPEWITDTPPDTIRNVLVGWWAQDNDHELYWEVGIGYPQYAGSNKWWIIRDQPEQHRVDGWMDIPAEPTRSE